MKLFYSLNEASAPAVNEPHVWIVPFNGEGVSPRERRDRRKEIVRSWLASLMGCSSENVQVDYTPLGKPYVAGCPFAFNVSCTKRYIALAAQTAKVIGVDIEDTTRRVDTEGVARRCFTEAERETMHTRRDFFALWTAKEAMLKAMGTGFTTDPRACELRLNGTRVEIACAPQGVPKDAMIEIYGAGNLQLAVCCWK